MEQDPLDWTLLQDFAVAELVQFPPLPPAEQAAIDAELLEERLLVDQPFGPALWAASLNGHAAEVGAAARDRRKHRGERRRRDAASGRGWA